MGGQLTSLKRVIMVESVENRTKKQIFQQAKEASNKLVLLNHPNTKRTLNELDRKEAEYLLWENNKIDKLVYKVLGDGGWNNFKPYKFSNKEIHQLANETKTLNLFLNSVEQSKSQQE
jgi:hypothetical protein